MARTSKNVLGNQSGRIGNVVGKVVDGVQMYSAYTEAIKNPRTARQIAHRTKFAAIIKVGKALKSTVNVGLKNKAATRRLMSPFDLFVKYNMQHVMYDAESETTTVDYEKLRIASGCTPGVLFAQTTFAADQKVSAAFDGNGDMPGTDADDMVYLIVYSPDLGKCHMATARRSTEGVTATLQAEWSGKRVHTWGFVRTSAKTAKTIEAFGVTLKPGECSDGAYLGSGIVA